MQIETHLESPAQKSPSRPKQLYPFVGRWWAVIVGVSLYLLSLFLVWLDKDFNLRWLNLGLWLAGLTFAGWGLLHNHYRQSQPTVTPSLRQRVIQSPSRTELFTFPALIVVSLLVYTLLLNVYPFSSIGDELRDTALYSAGIVKGEVRNFFSYGSYNSYGMLIPLLTTPLYMLLGPNVLVIRIAATIVGVSNIILLYFVARRFVGSRVAGWACVILIGLPLHLYYSRTEVVVLFSAFWFLVLVWCFGRLFEQPNLTNYGLIGLASGLALNFHASAKTIALTTLGLVVGYSLVEWLKKRVSWKKLLLELALLSLFGLVGFGPIILFSPAEFFFQTPKASVVLSLDPATISQDPLKNGLGQVGRVFENYPKSLLVYFYEPTNDHYHDHKPILPFVLGLFFVMGLVQALLSNRPWLRLLGIYALVIPFTNSVLTDLVNADRRLTALLPISAILTAYGAAQISLKVIKARRIRTIAILAFTGLFGLTSVFTTYGFFSQEAASYGMYRLDASKVYQDYMLTYAIKTVQTTAELQAQKSLCLQGTKATVDYLKLGHVAEQFKFYLSDKTIETKILTNFEDDQSLYLAPGCHATTNETNWRNVPYCRVYERFVCPPDRNRFFIYVPR